MAKAEQNGEYRDAAGNYYVIRKGDDIPDGAELVAAPERRAQPKAPENKARAGAPESKGA